MPDGTNIAPKRRKRTRLIWCVLVAGLVLFLLGQFGTKREEYFSLKFEGFRTNAPGVEEAVFTMRNEADDCWIDGVEVDFAVDGVYVPFGSEAMRSRKGSWMTSFMEGGSNTAFLVKDWTNSNLEIRASTGRQSRKGQVTEFTFRKPTNSFKLLIDCQRQTKPKQSALFQKVAAVNEWAWRNFDLPVIFRSGTWMHVQVTSPAFPARALVQNSIPGHLQHAHKFSGE